jgi:NADH-quinone oxidoreductase subunit J
MFAILAVVILASALLCVTTTRIMRAATFMLFVLLGVAGLYFLLDYTYLGAAQIAVYAGGVTMLFVFAIQLVTKQTLQGMVERMKRSRLVSGLLIAVVGFAVVTTIVLKADLLNRALMVSDTEVPMTSIGHALVGAGKYEYVLPFEFVSVFLLACIIGALVISNVTKKEEK